MRSGVQLLFVAILANSDEAGDIDLLHLEDLRKGHPSEQKWSILRVVLIPGATMLVIKPYCVALLTILQLYSALPTACHRSFESQYM